ARAPDPPPTPYTTLSRSVLAHVRRLHPEQPAPEGRHDVQVGAVDDEVGHLGDDAFLDFALDTARPGIRAAHRTPPVSRASDAERPAARAQWIARGRTRRAVSSPSSLARRSARLRAARSDVRARAVRRASTAAACSRAYSRPAHSCRSASAAMYGSSFMVPHSRSLTPPKP